MTYLWATLYVMVGFFFSELTGEAMMVIAWPFAIIAVPLMVLGWLVSTPGIWLARKVKKL